MNRQPSVVTPPTRREFLQFAAVSLAGATMPGPAPAAATTPPRTLHPYPNRAVWGDGFLRLKGRTRLAVGGAPRDVVALIRNTWDRFSLGYAPLDVATDAALGPSQLVLADGRPPRREPGDTYALAAGPRGLGVDAADAGALRHAWYTLLQLLQPSDDGTAAIPEVEIRDAPAVAFRGLHLCVFRETMPLMIEKAIRLAAFLKFSHVAIEFWGMLRLDAMRELSWPEAWSRREAGRLIAAARSMGMEIIPMFNSWGHASASRIRHGRHVVLDQNPALAPLFEPDGWTWCLTNPRAQAVLRDVADELIEVAGPGQFFHIGCDEAYSHATCDRCRLADPAHLLADHINGLAAHIEGRGRRAIMWGDALLERGAWPAGFEANGTPDLPTHRAIDRISKKVIVADWHYGVTKGDVPTLAYFQNKGFATLACPWNSARNIRTLARAARATGSGFLMTTWHRLGSCLPLLPLAAACVWARDDAAADMRQMNDALARAATAALVRKLTPAGGRFDRAGWNPFEQPAEVD